MRCKFHVFNILQLFAVLLLLQWASYLVGFEGVPVMILLSFFVFLFLELIGPILSVSFDQNGNKD